MKNTIKTSHLFEDLATSEEVYHRLDKRWNADSLILRYAHRKKFEKLLEFINIGESLLDLGRGGSVDGVLGVLAAKKGANVTISNVSDTYIQAIRKFARLNGVEEKINFKICSPQTGELYSNSSFDIVVSLHVLEHLENFNDGLKTLKRVSKHKVIVALPTCLNTCVWIRFGKGNCYKFSFKSFFALFKGLFIVIGAFITNKEGVIEILTEDSGNKCEHLWRFPWRMRRSIKEHDFDIVKFGPDTMCLPWFKGLQSVTEFLDRIGYLPIINNFGYGSHALLKKKYNIIISS